MINILSIDQSISSTAICVNGDIKTIKTSSSLHTFQRIKVIIDKIKEIIDSNKINCVSMEQYAFNMKNTSSLSVLMELGGNLKMLFYENGLEPIIISPKRWKKMILGNSSIDKNLILLEIYKRFGIECKNDDEADAYAMYLFVGYILEYFNGKKFSNKHHQDVFYKLVFELIEKDGYLKEEFKDKRIASFAGLKKHMDEKEILKKAKDIFYEKFVKLEE